MPNNNDPINVLPKATLPLTGNEIMYLIQGGLDTQAPVSAVAPIPNNVVTPVGLLPSTTFSYNPLAGLFASTSDNAADLTGSGTNIPSLVVIDQLYGGSNINDGRNGLSIFTALTTPTSPTNAYRFYVGMSAYSNAFVSDNGTLANPQGVVEAVTGSSQLAPGATNFFALLGGEFTVSANTGSSVTRKAIVCLNNWPTDTVQGSHTDAHIWSTAHTGSFGSQVWAKLDDDAGVFPISTGGTLIQLVAGLTSPSIGTGIDFAGIPITGNVLQWNSGFSFLAGSGAARLATLALNEPLPGGSILGIQGLANAYAAIFNGSLTPNQSFGLRIDAGTSATDYALAVQNSTGITNFLLIDGTGKSFFNSAVGVNGVTPPAQVTGWGNPIGASVSPNFTAGSGQTMAVVSAVVAQLIKDLKAFGVYGT